MKETDERPARFTKADQFYGEFDKESDRAAVILAVAMLDEVLLQLLCARLVAVAGKDDMLLRGSRAPIGTFSARIDLAFRVGLIHQTEADALHVIRKIRNAFAHDVTGCTFEETAVKDRVMHLYNLLDSRVPMSRPHPVYGPPSTETRTIFLRCASWLLFWLWSHHESVEPIIGDRGWTPCDSR